MAAGLAPYSERHAPHSGERPLIRLLDDATINRIAAGEVVERPASAVKELVENAIDAGANRIVVSLMEGGKRSIEVVDDGWGMSAEEMVLAVQRHATSKLTTSDDLFRISTLGFRGEALPSIAGVSRFTLVSRVRSSDEGAQLRIHNGVDIEVTPCSAAPGTRILVEDLFHSTPARLKFLKSTATEVSRACDAVGQLAIGHPGVSFRLLHGPQELLHSPGSGDALAAIHAIWGKAAAERLLSVAYHSAGLNVSGYVASPEMSRPGRSHELFYVNGRPVRSRLLSHAVENAYRALTPDGRYPAVIIHLEVDPGCVDVNVHPSKLEVKFSRDSEVHHAVGAAVSESLRAAGVLPTVSAASIVTYEPSAPMAGASFVRESAALFDPAGFAAASRLMPVYGGLPSDERPFAYGATEAQGNDRRPFAEQLRGFRVLGQARNTYIVAATQDGIAFIDQHVAHERVLYEYLTEKRAGQGTHSQRLLEPETLTLAPAEAALLTSRLADFAAAGWEIEPFGPTTFLLRAAPSFARKRGHAALLKDMIDEVAHQSISRRLVVDREHVTITNACKMAVKAGDPLGMEEMVGLLNQLADTQNPYLCPHGRPIVVTVPYSTIDHKFHR